MRTLLCILVLAAFTGVAIADVTVTGTWSGSFILTRPNGEGKDSTALLKLTQDGTDVTGTVGPSEDERFPIQKGKIEGDRITLEVQDNGHSIKFDLTVVADRMTGEANMTDENGTTKAKLDVKRAK